jgi:molybdate-binding protein
LTQAGITMVNCEIGFGVRVLIDEGLRLEGIQEQYDLVIMKTTQNEAFIALLQDILQTESFRNELEALGGNGRIFNI